MKRIAIFGGSFNPIHVGHVRIARRALSEDMADEVWIMPSPQNPLKPAYGLLDERLRLKMVCKALENEPSIKASDFEFSLPRPTYTYLTLRALRREYTDKVFSLMIGSDNWAIFHRWRNYGEILENHNIIIYNRPGTELRVEDLPQNVFLLKGEMTDVSSTSIRRKVLAGEDISEDVPSTIVEMVRRYYAGLTFNVSGMELKKIKWGFIGCGEATEKKSGPAFPLVEASSIVAVMRRNEKKARDYAERHNIPRFYTDPQDLLDDREVNAVYIATPPSTHATYAIMAMKAGKPVYVEKPMAASYEDCLRINRISEQTGLPVFVAYYRRYLPYFRKVMNIVSSGGVGNVINVQIRFAVPPRDLDYNRENLPWRVQPDIAGGGYFYDLAPHQIDLLQQMFGPIVEAEGYTANRGGLYKTEDTVSACFRFMNGLPGSGSWCFVGHDTAREDCIEIIGDKGKLHFSVFTYDPIILYNEKGRQYFRPENPTYVQLPLIRNIVEHLQGNSLCSCDSISATSVNWVMDRILGKI